MKFTHTRPPWRVDDRGVIWAQASRTDDEDVCIAHTRSFNTLGAQAEANAKLLAVAPDMAEVLARLVTLIDETWLAARVRRSEIDKDDDWPGINELVLATNEARFVLTRISNGKTSKALRKERNKKVLV
jgi:hypothetical protein